MQLVNVNKGKSEYTYVKIVYIEQEDILRFSKMSFRRYHKDGRAKYRDSYLLNTSALHHLRSAASRVALLRL